MDIHKSHREAFAGDDSYLQAAMQDLFALGCYLYAVGKTTAGLKTCATALRAAKSGKENAILAYVEKNPEECFEAAWPHSELKPLMKEMQRSAS